MSHVLTVPGLVLQEQMTSTTTMLERIVAQAADPDGSFYFPLAKERVEAVRAVRVPISSALLS
jgi:hypothetical protein